MLWNTMMSECKNLVPADPCLAAAEFLDPEYKEENVEIIAWMTVSGSYNDTEQFDDITTLCFRYLGK